ncbi:hypothetical protein GCK72_004836 [Caenorhabditis remanei]|uniref:Uncharacterized protein n=1 Tax=Caenorhabditis remanei TaxID=31234 RepID=A0A6A5HC88_CAERE|nr:hypothetical protein GCK72_004836 [Caenorhabditis remanei]KAF1764885.1 hypothetical protein GCK72_004836 [Caenorhabditis remanei]
MSQKFWIFVICFWSGCLAQNETGYGDLKLEFVQTLWRHGDRAAIDELYPIFESNWTFGGGGLGELTPLGMSQMNDLGTLFRKIYVEDKEFLSHRYTGKEIYIRSTNVNRTIISAMSMLYGLYPPGAWNIQGVDYPNSIDWQQGFTFVPVHVDGDNHCAATQQCKCARDDELQDKMAELPEVQTVNARMLTMNLRMAALFNVTEDADTFSDYPDAWKCQRNWFNDTLYEKLPFYNEALFQESQRTFAPYKQMMEGHFVQPAILNGVDIAHETRVLQSGVMLNEIYERVRDKAECLKSGENCTGFFKGLKFYGYSSHDLVIYAILVSLGVQDSVKTIDGWPDTAASLTIELYSNPDNQYFIKFLYRDNSVDDFSDVTSKVCNRAEYCTIEDFRKIAEMYKPLPDYKTVS